MKRLELSKAELRTIDSLVTHFEENKLQFSALLTALGGYISASPTLPRLIHSTKQRVKDTAHLKDKLVRKTLDAKAKGDASSYSIQNLFTKINDLAGFRIIHLHTTQIEQINKELLRILEEQRWVVVEGPCAKTWDDENRSYFESLGMKAEKSVNLYTSVHYVVQPNSKHELTCEIQVRTLMEEVWGEVDHTINYPHKSKVVSCREQIKVLARMTSTCSRLVDSIFLTDMTAASDAPQVLSLRVKRPTRAARKSETS